MADLFVSNLGVAQDHEPDFVIDRPKGFGEYLIMRFLNPFEILTTAGRVVGSAGDCIVHTPTFPNWHRGRETGFINDWFHLSGPAASGLIRRSRLPINELFRPTATDFLPGILEVIVQERYAQAPLWRERVALRVEEIFLLLTRHWPPAGTGLSPAEAEHQAAFQVLRREIHERLTETWTVAAMARQVNLSPNRFAVLYRKLFGVSPVEDLLQARLEQAKFLLTNRAVPVGEAARQSGFPNIYYFSRLFRARVGCPPRDYYRRLTTGAPPIKIGNSSPKP